MKIDVIDISAHGKTLEYPEDRFEKLLEDSGIPYLKICPQTDHEKVNEWLKEGNLEDNIFTAGIPDYIISHKPLFVEVKGYSDGLRRMQVKWIEKYDYEVKLMFIETCVAELSPQESREIIE